MASGPSTACADRLQRSILRSTESNRKSQATATQKANESATSPRIPDCGARPAKTNSLIAQQNEPKILQTATISQTRYRLFLTNAGQLPSKPKKMAPPAAVQKLLTEMGGMSQFKRIAIRRGNTRGECAIELNDITPATHAIA